MGARAQRNMWTARCRWASTELFSIQLGSGSQICWDASHKHKVPCTDMMRHKSEMLGKIRAYIKSKKPDLAFGTEYVGDATSRHIDFAHSCGMDYSAAKKRPDGKPLMRYVPLFKYAFPKVIFRTAQSATTPTSNAA